MNAICADLMSKQGRHGNAVVKLNPQRMQRGERLRHCGSGEAA